MKVFTSAFRAFFVSALFSCSLFSAQLSDALRVDGYANFHLEDSSRSDTNEDSIYASGGLQARYKFNERFSATGQVFAQEKDDYEPSIKWLYADWYLGSDIILRAGRFQFPVFRTLESGYIGYTTTWSKNPLKTYGVSGYDHFDGGELLYRYFYSDYEFSLQLSYGASKDRLPPSQDGNFMEVSTSSLAGLTLKVNSDLFWLNFGYLQAKTDAIDMQKNGVSVDRDKIDFYMIALEGGVEYENFYLKSGLVDGHLSKILPDEFRFYTSIEYSYYDFTPYIFYAHENLTYKLSTRPTNSSADSQNQPPPPLAPKRDREVEKKLDTYSIGLRYDIALGIALKASYSYEVLEDRTLNSQNGLYETKKNRNNRLMAVINVVF